MLKLNKIKDKSVIFPNLYMVKSTTFILFFLVFKQCHSILNIIRLGINNTLIFEIRSITY